MCVTFLVSQFFLLVLEPRFTIAVALKLVEYA